jgi:hypothetical protein
MSRRRSPSRHSFRRQAGHHSDGHQKVAAFTSERWPPSSRNGWPPSRRNGWPDSLGIPSIPELSPTHGPGAAHPWLRRGRRKRRAGIPVTPHYPNPALRATPRLRAAPLHNRRPMQTRGGHLPGPPKDTHPENLWKHRARPSPQTGSGSLAPLRSANLPSSSGSPPPSAASWRAAREPPSASRARPRQLRRLLVTLSPPDSPLSAELVSICANSGQGYRLEDTS